MFLLLTSNAIYGAAALYGDKNLIEDLKEVQEDNRDREKLTSASKMVGGMIWVRLIPSIVICLLLVFPKTNANGGPSMPEISFDRIFGV
jgi:hypothetical protein